VSIATDVIDSARWALYKLAAQINHENYTSIAKVLAYAPGKIVTTGVGKSFYLAEKMAGTLSSLGMPAYAINGANLGHGDYGSIASNDVVVLFSKSGRTEELNLLSNHPSTKILVTENRSEKLASFCDHVVKLPQMKEAAGFSAPTTSFTVFGVVGDALALEAATLRGLSDADLAFTHPAGNLGLELNGK
jgi:arabinose-5-phosphate isomerase